ncbi:hypothetical protein O3P69_015216 [Scylla paramamosain]
MDPPPHKVRVCVIGAGIAGLGAAQRLVEAGIQDFVLLEAADRTGGRICTIKHGDGHLEVGAHWIHGQEDNVVFQWGSENGLTSEEFTWTQTARGNTMKVRRDGKIVSEDVFDEFSKTFEKLEESSKGDFADYPGSVGRYFTEKFKAVNKWGALGDELLDWEGRFASVINGSHNWFQVSAKGLLQYKECAGNPVVNWKERGYLNLTDHLMEKVPPSCIKLSSPVKNIEWGEDVLPSGAGCKITLTSGAVIEADHVIFTPSIGVLKEVANEMFTPPLPTKKMKAIEGLDINVVNKIYIEFPQRWWSEDCEGFTFLPSAEEKHTEITEENWELSLLGFYSTYRHPTMMCGWITGTGALMMEHVPEEEVAQRCTAYLRKMLPPKYQIPDAVFCKRSTWGTYQWSRGAYSFRSLKTQTMGVWAADLAEPLLDSKKSTPLVCFAGEATHDCYYSTVHGALETGWREADRLTKYFSSVLKRDVLARMKGREKYTVVIVGAGVAGIGAARELKAQGINSVLLLEASDRIGGRILTVTGPEGVTLELGAQWIHGQTGNMLYQFAKSRNLLHHHLSVDGEGIYLMEGGKKIDEGIVKEVFEITQEADRECSKLIHRKNNTTSTPPSVGHVFRKLFFDYLGKCNSDSPETRRIKEALFSWALRWYSIDNACDSLHQMSSICWGSFIFCDGDDNMNPKNGYLSILEALLAEADADVKLNSEVECIKYASEVMASRTSFLRPDGVTFPIIIRCRDGKEYEAQHVMVTPSIGYLKKNLNIFSPPLPTRLQNAIMSRGFGTLGKIFLEYEDAWWWEGCEGIQLVWTKDIADSEHTTSAADSVDRKQQQTSDWWVKGISGFDPVFNHKAVLCGWIGGREAEHMETLSEAEIGQACTRVLRLFLGQQDIPFPKRVYKSQWATNHLFEGSYSYHDSSCNCWSGKKYESYLDTPVLATDGNGNKIPLLVLAGEAISVQQYSTVHGALQSGIEQAAHFVTAQKSLGANRKLWSKI